MSTVSLWIRYFYRGGVVPLTIVVDNGVVAERLYGFERIQGIDRHVDLSRGVAFPGFIDIHCHLRGLELSYKEDEETGTRAAAKGGYVAVVDMPNTKPRVNNVESLRMKLSSLNNKSCIDYGVWIAPSLKTHEVIEMLRYPGVVGIKIFPEDFNLLSTMLLMNVEKLKLIVHAEDPYFINECRAGSRWKCRPIEGELKAVERVHSNLVSVSSSRDIRIHITHVTNPLTLLIAKKMGFTADTCPHYLYLSSVDELRSGCIAKVNPPLRHLQTPLSLLKFIKYLDAISTDHAPHSIDEKSVDFTECPSGIASIEYAALATLNLALRAELDLNDVVRLLSKGPSELLELRSFGDISPGSIASYTVVDFSGETRVKSLEMVSKAKNTPYDGAVFKGSILATVVRGRAIYMNGEFIGGAEPMPLTEVAKANASWS
ncbi:MAG: dihydroorotase family protein [Sulfolobales archaeon]|nr:dihydroorotase family protein [Sulfolobales archaeon]MCX8199342.1 dihydroorotase family protein [Sulfolobales archaeon]MDW8170344.1 dihydroorotase family protein [Desulfurococcaceae archaeon]